MTSTFSFEIASPLAASRADVWAHASSMAGVNHELGPFLRMTYPPAFATLHQAPRLLGQRLFRSWVVLAGVIPIELGLTQLRACAPASLAQTRSAAFWDWPKTAGSPDE